MVRRQPWPGARDGRRTVIRDRTPVFSTPWFELVAKHTDLDPQPYYSIRQADYVALIAITTSGDHVFVRQYRPAVEDYTLELASGLVDGGRSPEETVLRELEEETGYRASNPQLLGVLNPDSGRLQNRLWCYVVRNAEPIPGHDVERGMEPVVVGADRVDQMLRDGEMGCALHYAAYLLLRLRTETQPR